MVKIIELEGSLAVDPETAFRMLFEDDKFVKRFHKEANNDPSVQVSSWSKEGRREVRFLAPVSAPKVVQMILATDKLPVKESQQFMKQGVSFFVRSEPTFEVQGGDRFRTSGELLLSPGSQGSSIRMKITLECNPGVWGIQGTVENYMEIHARKSFFKWLSVAHAFCEEQRSFLSVAVDKHVAAKGKHVVTEEKHVAAEEQYFDAPEDHSEHYAEPSLDRSCSARPVAVLEGKANGKVRIDLTFVESILNELNALHNCSHTSREQLEKLNAILQKIQEDVSTMKSYMDKQDDPLVHRTWSFVALGVAFGLLFGMRRIYLQSRK